MSAAAFGQLVGAGGQIGLGIEQGLGDAKANNLQWYREQMQADTAIRGAIDKSTFEQEKTGIGTAELTASQRQAYVASGVDATRGTAAQVQANTAALGAFDRQQEKINAAKEVWGLGEVKEQSSQEYRSRMGNINRQEAGSILGGMSKWMGGGASMAGG